MTRKIKVNKKSCILGVKGTSIQMNLQEVQELIAQCHQSGCIVVDTKNKEIIREITPEISEITILLSRGSFGG